MKKDGQSNISDSKTGRVERRFRFLPGDALIIAAVVVFSVSLILGLFIHGKIESGKEKYVCITQDGQVILYRKMSAFTEPSEYVIETENGRMVIYLSSEKVYVKESSCPDHICEKYGELKDAGDGAVCLPNHVVVEIRSDGSDDGKDAVAR